MKADRSHDHELLVKFAASIEARPTIQRDGCGDWALEGRYGCIYSVGIGESSYQIVLDRYGTARKWVFAKKSLAFCRLEQDGDAEGVLRLERLPTHGEAPVLRAIVGLAKKRTLTPEQREAAIRRLTPFKPKGNPA